MSNKVCICIFLFFFNSIFLNCQKFKVTAVQDTTWKSVYIRVHQIQSISECNLSDCTNKYFAPHLTPVFYSSWSNPSKWILNSRRKQDLKIKVLSACAKAREVVYGEQSVVIHSACGRQRSIVQLLSGCCVKQWWRRHRFVSVYMRERIWELNEYVTQ